MTIELIRTDVDPAEVIYEEVTDDTHRLRMFALQAELLNRDEEGEYTARERPEEVPES